MVAFFAEKLKIIQNFKQKFIGNFRNTHCLTTIDFYYCHISCKMPSSFVQCAKINVLTGRDLWQHHIQTK